MSLFERFANNYFERLDDGRTIFYPNGGPGSGYILSDDAQSRRARGFIKKSWLAAIAIIAPILILTGSVGSDVVASLIYWGGFQFALRRMLRSFQPPPERLSVRKSFVFSRWARKDTAATAAVRALIAVLLITFCASLLTLPHLGLQNYIIAVVGLFLFVTVAIHGIFTSIAKLKHQRDARASHGGG